MSWVGGSGGNTFTIVNVFGGQFPDQRFCCRFPVFTKGGAVMRCSFGVVGLFVALGVLVGALSCGGGGGGDEIDPAAPHLFVANTDDDSISRYTVDPATGELDLLGETTLPVESKPTDMLLHPNGLYFYCANSSADSTGYYDGGNVAVFAYASSTGDLMEIPNSPYPAGSMALQIDITPDGNFLYSTSQNLDSITIFAVNGTTGELTEAASSPMDEDEAHGIRMHPSGDFVYMGNEDNHEIAGYSINAVTGSLTPVPNSPYSVGSSGNANWITITPDGKFLYSADSYQSDEIYGYIINTLTGELTAMSGFPVASGNGTGHKSLVTAGGGDYLYLTAWTTDEVLGYSINPGSGALTAVPNMPFATGDRPKSLAVDDGDNYLYVANYGSEEVDLFEINDSTGELTYVETYDVGSGPKRVVYLP